MLRMAEETAASAFYLHELGEEWIQYPKYDHYQATSDIMISDL